MKIVFDEGRVVVVDKDSGVTSEEVARVLARRLVHRIDRGTSGLLMLADDARTVTRMQRALRAGNVERTYCCVAHGFVVRGTRESYLVRNRGDGLRGSDGSGAGKLAVLEVTRSEQTPDRRASMCEVRLVTGRTHQVRIQLAEAGHPLVGETVYVRDARAAGLALLDARRLMLHAMALRFRHPNTKLDVLVRSALPVEFRVLVSETEAAME